MVPALHFEKEIGATGYQASAFAIPTQQLDGFAHRRRDGISINSHLSNMCGVHRPPHRRRGFIISSAVVSLRMVLSGGSLIGGCAEWASRASNGLKQLIPSLRKSPLAVYGTFDPSRYLTHPHVDGIKVFPERGHA
jgi:hypothetical protein